MQIRNEANANTSRARVLRKPRASFDTRLLASPAPAPAALAGKPYDIYLAPFDVRLPKADEADEEVDTVVQPDILIVRDLDKLDDRGMRGAPDWLAEILSPSTAHHDRVVKLAAYERAGVREVWLVNPMNRTLTLYQLQDGRYGPPILQSLSGKTFLTAIPGLHVDWDRLLSGLK